MPDIIPIRDLKNTASISDLCKRSPEPIYVTKNGYGDMVIMSLDVYERKMALLEVYEKVIAAEEERTAKKISDAPLALKKIREKYGV